MKAGRWWVMLSVALLSLVTRTEQVRDPIVMPTQSSADNAQQVPPPDPATRQANAENDAILPPKMEGSVMEMIKQLLDRVKKNGGKPDPADQETMETIKKLAAEDKALQKEVQKMIPDSILKNQFTDGEAKVAGEEAKKQAENEGKLEADENMMAKALDKAMGSPMKGIDFPFPAGFEPSSGGAGGAGGMSPEGAAAAARADALGAKAASDARRQEAKEMERRAKELERDGEKKKEEAYAKLAKSRKHGKGAGSGNCKTDEACEEECPIGEWRAVKDLVKVEAITAKCDHFDKRGKGDKAAAADNLRDAFKGRPVKLSKYGDAPGGKVCLSRGIARLLIAVAQEGVVDINSLTGSSHSWHRSHYQGRAVDIGMLDGKELGLDNRLGAIRVIAACKRAGATRILNANMDCGPLCDAHTSWVHCELPDEDLEGSGGDDDGTAYDPSLAKVTEQQEQQQQPQQQDGQGQGQDQQPPQQPPQEPQGNHISISHDKENGFAASAKLGKLGVSVGKKGFSLDWNK